MTTMTVPAPAVLGVDLSLSSTGLALPDGTVETFKPHKGDFDRIETISLRVVEAAIHSGTFVDVVAMEGLNYGAKRGASSLADLAGLHYVVRQDLWRTGINMITWTPSQVKLYATGHGQSKKLEMVAAARHYLGLDLRDSEDDAADAAWVRAMALDYLGAPPVPLPDRQRATLTKTRRLDRLPDSPALHRATLRKGA